MDHRQGERHPSEWVASLSAKNGNLVISRCRIRNLSRDGIYLEYPAGEHQLLTEYDFVKVSPGHRLTGPVLEGIVCHASRNGAGIMLKAVVEGLHAKVEREGLETAA